MAKTHKQKLNKRLGLPQNTTHTLSSLARRVPTVGVRTLEEVYARGVAAHKTNPESVRMQGSFKKDPSAPLSKKLSAEQWGHARVYAFLNKLTGPEALNHDTDLLRKKRTKK